MISNNQTSLHEQFLFGNCIISSMVKLVKITRWLRSTLENVHKRLGVVGEGDLQRRMFPKDEVEVDVKS